MKSKLRRNLFILLCIMATVSFLSGCFNNFSQYSANVLRKEDAKKFTIEKSSVEAITQISISTRVAEVELIEADNYYVQVDYLYWDKEPEYSIENGKLHFDDTDTMPDNYSINFNLNNVIKIYLPKNAPLDSLELDLSSGNASLSGFIATDMDLNLSYGDLTLGNAAAASAKLDLSSGDCTLNDFQAGTFDYVNSYGQSDFTNINTGTSILPSDTVFETFQVNVSSGDITIDGLLSDSVTLNNSYGNITCSKVNADQFTAKLSSGDIRISKSEINSLDLTDSYGDADISLPGTKADYKLNLKTSYGNIKVGTESYDKSVSINSTGKRSLSASLSSGNITVSFKSNEQ